MSELIDNFEIFDASIGIKKVIKRFYVFEDIKAKNVLFVTLNDKVFGFGSNDCGVCGFGHQMVVNEPKIIEELCDKSVIQFYNGIYSAFALTSDNKLYGWGNNEFGQLGLKVVNFNKVYKPVLIEDLNDINIKQISCGASHTLVLTFDGMVYGWGNNEGGQIGCGKESGEKISVIMKLEALPKIKLIHCSYYQSFALTDNKMVYSWGWNGCCELGHELKQNECIFEPKLIINFTNITSIRSSNTNTYFLTSEGNVYFCGLYYEINDDGCYQLLPKLLVLPENIKLLQKIKSFEFSLSRSANLFLFQSFIHNFNIVRDITETGLIAFSVFRTLTSKQSLNSITILRKSRSIGVLINDSIYKLNYNKIEKTRFKSLQEFYSKNYKITFGTISLNDNSIEEKIVETITQRYIGTNPISSEILKNFTICNNNILNNFSIKYIHVFDDKIGFNVLFVTMDDEVFGYGSNQWGVCGLGHNKNVKDPQIIPELCDKNIQQFYNGLGFAFGLTSDNELYGWGSNNWLQLGRKLLNQENTKPIKIDIEKRSIKQISCGSYHTLVLTCDGIVYGWGDNTYGQIGCGKELGEKTTMARLISLPKIKLIHCLFFTSFALTDNGMVYSWGQNIGCELGHELNQNGCVFEPKLIINLTNITSICSSNRNIYFLSNNGNIYFGEYSKTQNKIYQIVPKLLTNEVNIHLLHSIDCYQQNYSIGCALSDEWVYSLKNDSIEKTNYKTLEEFYSNECQLSYKTYYLKLISGIQEIKMKTKGEIIPRI